MTAEEYAIERLVRLDREIDTLRGLNNRSEEDNQHLIKTCDRLNNLNRGYRDKLEEIKQTIIFTLDHNPDRTSDVMIYKDDVQDLIKILDIKIDDLNEEVPDEVPED